MKHFILLLMMGVMGIACSDDAFVSDATGSGQGDVPIRLTITTPAATVYTRVGNQFRTTDRESAISEIQVLVFENGEYRYRVPGIAINSNGSRTTFDARLSSSNQPLKLFIVANATAAVIANEPQQGDSEMTVKKRIRQPFGTSGLNAKFPMFAEYEINGGLDGGQVNNITGLQALRSIARVDVQAGTVNNFRLASVQVFRANSLIQVMHEGTGLTMTAPVVPATSTGTVNTVPVAVDGYESVGQLYLPESVVVPEADRWTKATCIVVGGYYEEDETPTYYRMDFDPRDENGVFGQILRNHKYIFNIRSVSGSGWRDPEDAAVNVSSHIEVEIKAWDDNTQDMYFDGEHHFGVSAREVILNSKVNSVKPLFVNTDIADYTLQWSDSQGNTSGNPATLLTSAAFKVEKSADGKQIVVTALQDNSEAVADKVEYFVVTANRWQVLITIRQRNGVIAGRMVNMMTFNAGLGALGQNILPPLNGGESRSDGLRGILTNKNNFGPSGVVECGGFNLLLANASKDNLTDDLFATADIIYVNYMANSSFGSQDAAKVHNWLKASRNRVLIVSCDAYDVSVPLMTEILGTTDNLIWLRKTGDPFTLTGKSSGNYFTDAGPFTQKYGAIPLDFSLRNYDTYHGEIGAGSAAGIFPILMGPGTGTENGIVLGVDFDRRIIYWGDVDLGNTSTGNLGNSDNRITNTTGEITNNASKLIANVMAWAVGVVLDE